MNGIVAPTLFDNSSSYITFLFSEWPIGLEIFREGQCEYRFLEFRLSKRS